MAVVLLATTRRRTLSPNGGEAALSGGESAVVEAIHVGEGWWLWVRFRRQ